MKKYKSNFKEAKNDIPKIRIILDFKDLDDFDTFVDTYFDTLNMKTSRSQVIIDINNSMDLTAILIDVNEVYGKNILKSINIL